MRYANKVIQQSEMPYIPESDFSGSKFTQSQLWGLASFAIQWGPPLATFHADKTLLPEGQRRAVRGEVTWEVEGEPQRGGA